MSGIRCRASSGAIKQNFAQALGLRFILTKPPLTFMERLMCSSALSAPRPQNGTVELPSSHLGIHYRSDEDDDNSEDLSYESDESDSDS